MKLRFSQKEVDDDKNVLVYRDACGNVTLRNDLYGIPAQWNFSVMSSCYKQASNYCPFPTGNFDRHYLLGKTQLTCWDPIAKFPSWCYQRVDFAVKVKLKPKNRYYFADLRLLKQEQRKPGWPGYQRGHFNTFSFCQDLYDSSWSNSQLNIGPHKHNTYTLERKIARDIKQTNAIGHVTTLATYKLIQDTFVTDMLCKVVFLQTNNCLKLNCYLLNDNSSKAEDYREASLRDVEHATGLTFLDPKTVTLMSAEDLELHKKFKYYN